MNKLSVCLITYNQQNYLKDALYGIVEQKTNFNFELVIAEDCSSDQTRKIIEDFVFPAHIHVIKIFNNNNLGHVKNYSTALSYCTGKYIALCEGDDYWIDVFKLQKQVDFLDNNEGFSLCFHNCLILENGKKTLCKIMEDTFGSDKVILDITDLVKVNFVHTPSVVFRNSGILASHPLFKKSPVGDYITFLLLALEGNLKYFNEPMAVYRIHETGVWSKIAFLKKRELIVDYLQVLYYHFPEPYNKLFRPRLKREIYKNAKIDISNKRFINGIRKCINYLKLIF